MSTPMADPRDAVFVTQYPWGQLGQYSTGRVATVKVMSVLPGHRLSLQRHRLRGEMWQLLDERLTVTVGLRTWAAEPGEMLWIPPGERHRISNEGGRVGRVLEVAFGEFDEDDIERLSDDYERVRVQPDSDALRLAAEERRCAPSVPVPE